MKKSNFLAILILLTCLPFTALAADEPLLDFTMYKYIHPEDIPEDTPSNKMLVYVEESFSNEDLYEIRNQMSARSYDWRTQLPLTTDPIYAEEQNMSLRMYFDLRSDVFQLAFEIEDRAELYNIEKRGSFLSPESYSWYQNHLAHFQTLIPTLTEELEFAQAYSGFVRDLSEDEARKLFGPMLTREADAEETMRLSEAALKQLEYLQRIELTYVEYPFPERVSAEQLQDLIDEHGFSEEEQHNAVQESEGQAGLPQLTGTATLETSSRGGIPWGRMLGWTLFGSALGWLGKKAFDRLRVVMARKFIEMLKKAAPEERKEMLKNFQSGTKARNYANAGAAKAAEKISPFSKATRFFSEKIGRRVPVAATIYSAYDTFDTITDPELVEKEKWKQTTATLWKGAWAVVGGAAGTLISPGYGSVAVGFAGYTFGEMTSSWAEKAGENLYHLFH